MALKKSSLWTCFTIKSDSHFAECNIEISCGGKNTRTSNTTRITSIDVLPFKNQALCEFCTHVNQLKVETLLIP